jgi:hypothetical protein
MPHEIRLAGPWEFSTDDGSMWNRCVLPFDAAQDEISATAVVRVRRRFHKPSGLEPSSVVSIIVAADHEVGQIVLNDCQHSASTVEREEQLPSSVTSHFRVDELLNEFNTLQLTVSAATPGLASTIHTTRLRIVDV